jgi:hypothetical protein
MGLALAANSSGAFDLTAEDLGADNVLGMVITDSSTVTSGYVQGYYCSMTTSGAYSTASTQINAMAVDLILGGTVACEAEGLYIYVAGTDTPTLTSSNINGINVYIDDLGAAPGSRCALQLHIADGNAASNLDAFIAMRLEGGSGAVTNMFQKAGTASNPTYFLATNATNGMILAGDFLGGTAAATHGLACNINGSVRYIPLVSNT